MFNFPYIQTSGKKIKTGDFCSYAAFANWDGSSNPLSISKDTNVCMQSTLQINLQFPLLFVKQVHRNHICSHKSKIYICNLHKLF